MCIVFVPLCLCVRGAGKTDDGEKMGWGAVVIEEAEDHKRSFYNEYGGDQERFFEWWPQVGLPSAWVSKRLEAGMPHAALRLPHTHTHIR